MVDYRRCVAIFDEWHPRPTRVRIASTNYTTLFQTGMTPNGVVPSGQTHGAQLYKGVSHNQVAWFTPLYQEADQLSTFSHLMT